MKKLLFIIFLTFAFFNLESAHISDHLAPDGSKEVKEQKEIKENDEITKRYELISQCMNLPPSEKYIFENIIKGYEDTAYEKYLRDHLLALNQSSELAGFPRGLPEIIHNYGCISKEQWDKNNQDLINATIEGNNERVKELLDFKEVDVNYQDEKGRTALNHACYRASLAIVELLLNHQANPNIQSNQGTTALILAVRQDRFEITKLLLDHGSDVNIQDKDGETALTFAIRFTLNFEIVKLLVEKGANVNVQEENRKETALMILADKYESKIKLKITKLLLDHNANVNLQNIDGQTALMKACNRKNLAMIKLLLENNANPNIEDNDTPTASMFAALRGDLESLNLLCEYKANVNFKSQWGMSAIDIAKITVSVKDRAHLEDLIKSSSGSDSIDPRLTNESGVQVTYPSSPSEPIPLSDQPKEGIIDWIKNNPKKTMVFFAVACALIKYHKLIIKFLRKEYIK